VSDNVSDVTGVIQLVDDVDNDCTVGLTVLVLSSGHGLRVVVDVDTTGFGLELVEVTGVELTVELDTDTGKELELDTDAGIELELEIRTGIELEDCTQDGVVEFVLNCVLDEMLLELMFKDVGEMGGEGIGSGEGIVKETGDAGRPLSK
jgi:hypothetical protein